MFEQDPGALARLLGVDPELDADRLRAAYDQEMTRATRAGDHRRALALSQAFDALPTRTRTSVYSGGRTYPTVVPTEPGRGRRAARSRPPRRPGGGGRTRAPGRLRRIRWRGVLGYGVLVPGIVLLVGWAVYRQQTGEQYAPPPVQRPSVSVPTPAAKTAGPAVLIPADAPVAANGLVSVLCQPAAGGPGYVMAVPPNTRAACSNNAVPRILDP